MAGGWSSDYDDEDLEETRKRQLASENSGRLAKKLLELIRDGVADPEHFVLTVDMLCELNSLAMEGLIPNAGRLRQCDVTMMGSPAYEPPPWQQIPALVGNLCRLTNGESLLKDDEELVAKPGGGSGDAVELAALVLWFLNWIHPFEDGNGRVARAASYLVLNVGLGQELAGEHTIIERLQNQKIKYWRCLEAADRAWHDRAEFDVSEMAMFLRHLLEAQLADD